MHNSRTVWVPHMQTLPSSCQTALRSSPLSATADNISNISADYYQRRMLTYTLGADDGLMEQLKKRKAASQAVE